MGLDPSDERAPYMQVAGALRASIRDGAYREGDRLPSIVELAEKFGVAPMTATRAVAALRSEGLLVSRQGRGTFVLKRDKPAGGVSDEIEALRQELARIRRRLDQLEADQQDD